MIGRISQVSIHANVEVNMAVTTVKCYVYHMVCDNLGPHNLFELYASRHSDEIHVVQGWRYLQWIKQSNLFVHVPQAFV